jgi:hypothetical protein
MVCHIKNFPVTAGIKLVNFKDGKVIHFIEVNAEDV